MEEFSCPTRIVMGAGALSALEDFGAKRLFLAADSGLAQDGTAQRVADRTRAEQVEIFAILHPNPGTALTGAERLRQFGPDLVAALGSGSTLECVKAMTWFACTDVPLAAIPTTPGSGSEVTDSAALLYGQTRRVLKDRRLRPAAAILDSGLLDSLPRGQMAAGGFDVLARAVESFASRHAGSMSRLLAKEAFSASFGALPAAFAGRQEARLRVQEASALAGLAMNQSGVGLCHAMARTLGAMFPAEQGRLHAVLLPAVMDCNALAGVGCYGKLARSAGLGGSTDSAAFRNLKSGILRLRRELELPQTLSQAGIPAREIWSRTDAITAAVLASPECGSNPVGVEDFMVRRILNEVSGH